MATTPEPTALSLELLCNGDTDFGPAMRRLPNEAMRRYVLIRVLQHKDNATEAARQAGYADSSYGSLKVQAHRLENNKLVQEAIHEESLRRARHTLSTALAAASERHVDIINNPQVKEADTLKAIAMLYDRLGLHAVTEQRKTVEHIGDSPEMLTKIAQLAKRLNIDPALLLGQRLAKQQAVVIDAKFEDVKPTPPNPLAGFL